MIWPLVAAAALLTGQIRLALGDAAPLAPSAAVAWALLYARRSRRGSFAAAATFAALIEAPTYDAPLIAAPLAALTAGFLGYATRFALPVRTLKGEGLAGALFAACAAFVFEGLQDGPGAEAPHFWGGVVATGFLCAALAALERRSPSLRAALARR
mgnify:CR=1 FL=1